MKIRPVIMAGGSGVRLWPLSREAAPKQLLPLVSEQSLLQQTLLRVQAGDFLAPIIICNEQYRFLVAEQLREAGIEGAQIVLEPVARNSAAAAGVGALLAERADPLSLVLLLPSDHVIRDVAGFRKAVEIAAGGAATDYLMTFGVAPTSSGDGVRVHSRGQRIGSLRPGCNAVATFVEKPDKAKASQLLAAGGHVWNSGMFMFKPRAFLNELKAFEPKILEAAQAAVEHAKRDLGLLAARRKPVRGIARYFHRLRGDGAYRAGSDLSVDVGLERSWFLVGDLGCRRRATGPTMPFRAM